MSDNAPPDWELVLSSADRLQELIPDAVLVGETAAAIFADHRRSRDADHVLTDLRSRFDEILAQLESVAGWRTARVQRPIMILGSLDGIETGVRQLIRTTPLETTLMSVSGITVKVPTLPEILRIKGALILKRNATRDYLDFVALASTLGTTKVLQAIGNFDSLYPQDNEESALQQLQVQLSSPRPYDLESKDLREYKDLDSKWQDWDTVCQHCQELAVAIFDSL